MLVSRLGKKYKTFDGLEKTKLSSALQLLTLSAFRSSHIEPDPKEGDEMYRGEKARGGLNH